MADVSSKYICACVGAVYIFSIILYCFCVTLGNKFFSFLFLVYIVCHTYSPLSIPLVLSRASLISLCVATYHLATGAI